MYRKILISLLLLSGLVTSAQMPDSVKVSIDSALTVLQRNSLYSKKVDWKKVRTQVMTSAKNAKNNVEAFPSLKIAFDALGDKHANFWYYGQNYRLPNPELNQRTSDSLRAKWAKGPTFGKKMIGDIAYLSVPTMPVNKPKDIDQYANWMYDAVAELAAKNPKGWIVDLRLNNGGNIRPMLSGLSPFFPTGVFGYYVDADSKFVGSYEFADGKFLMDKQETANVNKKIPAITGKVAVLIGAGTASSGEGTAVTFKQRSDTRLFGQKSSGMANSTNGFVFNNQQCYFLISTAYLADGKKKILPESVIPDQVVNGVEAYLALEKDASVQAAIQWLK